MSTLPLFPNILLALTTIVATALTVLIMTPPNPSPSTTTTQSESKSKSKSSPQTKIQDSIVFFTGPFFLITGRLAVTLLGLYHAFLSLTYPAPPLLVCPRQENLNPALFTWSYLSTVLLALILVAAPIRLLAFKQLGPFFTFQLAVPGKLVTTGLYKYVQHPSYTTNLIVVLANYYLLGRLEGVAGCWVPAALEPIFRTMGNILLGAGLTGTWIRVEDEESMLRRQFGQEWEVWHRKTKRFIPWLF